MSLGLNDLELILAVGPLLCCQLPRVRDHVRAMSQLVQTLLSIVGCKRRHHFVNVRSDRRKYRVGGRNLDVSRLLHLGSCWSRSISYWPSLRRAIKLESCCTPQLGQLGLVSRGTAIQRSTVGRRRQRSSKIELVRFESKVIHSTVHRTTPVRYPVSAYLDSAAMAVGVAALVAIFR